MVLADALAALEKLALRSARPFDLVFLDPPYAAEREYTNVLRFLGDSKLLATGGVLIAEHRKTLELADSYGMLVRYRILKQGDTALSFFRAGSNGE